MKPKNHYQVLGVSPTATEDEINRAYELRMQQLAGSGSAQTEAVRKAQAVLSDKVRRGIYDASLRKQEDEPPHEPEAVTVDHGVRLRWLAVLGAALLVLAASVWLINRKPAGEPTFAAKPASVGSDAELPAGQTESESQGYGQLTRKMAELAGHTSRLESLKQELETARRDLQYKQEEMEPEEIDSARRAMNAMQAEIDWLIVRIAVIQDHELDAERRGHFRPEQKYRPM